MDTAILVASLDHGQELKQRRAKIVDRLYATSNKCSKCDLGSGGGSVTETTNEGSRGSVTEVPRVDGETEEEVKEKSINDNEDDDDSDPFDHLFDDEPKSIHEIKEELEDPNLSEEASVKLLQNLEDMDITIQILQETEIGKQVNLVRKHSSNNVRRLAKQLIKKWKIIVKEWVNSNQSRDLQPPSLIAIEDSPEQKGLQNHQQVPELTQNGYSGLSKNSKITEPETKPRLLAAPPKRESICPRPSSQQTIQKEHKEVDFNLARKRLLQNYKEAENAKKQRTIQILDIGEIPKPIKGGFVPRKGGRFSKR